MDLKAQKGVYKGKRAQIIQEEIQLKGFAKTFPADIENILLPYWNQELGRLVNPLPDMQVVLDELKDKLGFLES